MIPYRPIWRISDQNMTRKIVLNYHPVSRKAERPSTYLLYCSSPRLFFVFFAFLCDGADVDPAGGGRGSRVAGSRPDLPDVARRTAPAFLSSSEEQTEMALSVSPEDPLLWLQGVAVGS